MSKIIKPEKLILSDGWNLNILSKRVATITDPTGKRKVSYFGFDNYEKAKAFRERLIESKGANAAIIRHAQRLSQAFECKAWGVSTELLIDLASRSTATTTTVPVEQT